MQMTGFATMLNRHHLRRPRATLLAVGFAALAVPWTVRADSEAESRYPYDPACPWGRVANGNGMIVRCLSEAEARSLAAGKASPKASPASETPQGKKEAASETKESASGEHATDAKQAAPQPVRVEVGPISAEDGEVGIGRLHVPKDRYEKCVQEHGGLSSKTGEVRVHFLVRGERQRAESVEVVAHRGVSREAAKCIADVVDRRKTGVPSAPMVGATLVFKLSPK